MKSRRSFYDAEDVKMRRRVFIILIAWGLLVYSEINTQINNVDDLNKAQNEVVEEKEKILDRRFEHLGKYSEIFKDIKRDDTLEKFSEVLDSLTNELLIQAVNDKADIPYFMNFSLFNEDELKKLLRNDLQNRKIKDLKEELYAQLKDEITRELLEITDRRKDIDIDKTIGARLNKKYPLYKYKDKIDLTVDGCEFKGIITNLNDKNLYINKIKYPKEQLSENTYKYFWEKEHNDFIQREIKKEKINFQLKLEEIIDHKLNDKIQYYVQENLVHNILLNEFERRTIKNPKDLKDDYWLNINEVNVLLKNYLVKCFKGDYLRKRIELEQEEKQREIREKEQFEEEKKNIAQRNLERKREIKKWHERQEEKRKRQEEERKKKEEEKRIQREENEKFIKNVQNLPRLQFLGLSVEGSMQDFVKKLEMKGYKSAPMKSHYHSLKSVCMKGPFWKFKDCEVHIRQMNDIPEITSIVINIGLRNSWDASQKELIRAFTSKYGSLKDNYWIVPGGIIQLSIDTEVEYKIIYRTYYETIKLNLVQEYDEDL